MQVLPRHGSLVKQTEADISPLTCGSGQVSIVHSLQWSTQSSRCLRVFRLNSHQNHFPLWFTLSTVVAIAVSIPLTKSCVGTRQLWQHKLLVEGIMVTGIGGSWSHPTHNQEVQRGECLCLGHILLFIQAPWPQPRWWCCPHVSRVFPLQPSPGTPLQMCPEVCLPVSSRMHWVGNQY